MARFDAAMRMIGHISDKGNAATFSDFLYVQGITNVIEQEKDGWAIWIHSEDELDKAKNLLSVFLADPADPKYLSHSRKAEKLKEREREAEQEAARKYFDRERAFGSSFAFGMGPVTTLLIAASIVVTVLSSLGLGQGLLDALLFSNSAKGAPEILNGQAWRLITPIFLHQNLLEPFGFLHLFFNVLWLYSLGTAVEMRYGSRWLLVFTLIIATVSNLGQYLVSGPDFCGLSGVVYALLGFIWIRGKFDPDAGLVLHPQTVSMMLIWYALCLFEFIPHIANTVHTIGLLGGMAWGYLSSLDK